MSSGLQPASAIARSAAFVAMSLVHHVPSFGTYRRSLIPVRCWIHASFVSVDLGRLANVLVVEERQLVVRHDALGHVAAQTENLGADHGEMHITRYGHVPVGEVTGVRRRRGTSVPASANAASAMTARPYSRPVVMMPPPYTTRRPPMIAGTPIATYATT